MVIMDAVKGGVLVTAEIGKGSDGCIFDPSKQYAYSSNEDGTISVVGEPHGTFHDAKLVHTKHGVDFTEMQFAMDVGDPDATSVEVRELRRAGVLIIHGLHDWILDPPEVKLGSWMT